MGLVASPSSSSLILIRRELVSWLRPVEALEQVVISGGGQGFTPDVFRDISPISDDPGLAQDVLYLLVAAGKVGKLLPPSTMAAFNEAVTRLNSPDVVSRGIAADLLADQEQPGALQEVLGRVTRCKISLKLLNASSTASSLTEAALAVVNLTSQWWKGMAKVPPRFSHLILVSALWQSP